MPRSYNPLAEFLISLANPRNLRAYRHNPSAYLQRFGVSAADRAAIASASAAAIRRRARGVGTMPGRIGRRPVPTGIFEIAEIAEIRERLVVPAKRHADNGSVVTHPIDEAQI